MPASVVAAQETVLNTLGTTHVLNVPAGAAIGHRLLIIANTGKNNPSPGMTWGGGFVERLDQTATEGGSVTLGMAEWEVSGSVPGTVTVSTVNNSRCTGVVLAITDHDPATPTEVAFTLHSSDPPNLAPSWGSELTLFGAIHSGNEDPFPFPAFMLPDEQHEVQGSHTKLYLCMQTLEAASLNPSTWQSGSPEASQRVVATFAIRGLAGGPDLAQLAATESITVLAPRKSKPAAQLAESSTINALTVRKVQVLAQLAEAGELIVWAGAIKTKPLGDILIESGSLNPLGDTIILGQIIEPPSQLLPMAGSVKSKPVGQLSATEALQALTAAKALPLGQLVEAGQLNALQLQRYLGQLVEASQLMPLLGGSLPDHASAASSGLKVPITTSGLYCYWCTSSGLVESTKLSTRRLSVSASSSGLSRPTHSSGLREALQ